MTATRETLRAILRSHAGDDGVERFDRAERARETYESTVRTVRAEHNARERDPRGVVSIGVYRASDASKRKGELVRHERVSRMKRRERRAHLDAFRRALSERGQRDAAPREIGDRMWKAGTIAMTDPVACVLALPPLVQESIRLAYTTPAREVFALLDERGMRHADPRDLSSEDLDAPIWSFNNPSHRKALAFIAVIFAGAEPTERPGFSHVTYGYALGAVATTIPNPLPYRRNRKRSIVGRAAARYGYESMTCADVDRFGLPRGALPIVRVWAALFGVGVTDAHQPDAGAPGLGASERGPSGRWAFNQYWIARDATWSRWDKAARRYVASPEVLAWLGRKPSDRDRREWSTFVGWVEETRAKHRGDAGDEERAFIDRTAETFASAEADAIDAHAARDVTRAVEASARAQAARLLGDLASSLLSRHARRRALERRGILDASRALREDLARRRCPD